MKGTRAKRIAVTVFVLVVFAAMVTALLVQHFESARARTIEGLLRQLASSDVRAREAAEDTLGGLRKPRDIRILVWSLAGTDITNTSFEVTLVFARIGEQAIEPVMSAARSLAKESAERDNNVPWNYLRELFAGGDDEQRPSKESRELAIDAAIGGIGEPAIPAVAAMLSDSEAKVRSFAVEVLVRIHGKEAANLLVPMVRDPDASVRESAWNVLSMKLMVPARIELRAGSPADVAALKTAMRSPNDQTRRVATLVLSAMEGAEAGDTLAAAMVTGDASTRLAAAKGLALRGDKRALPAILDEIRKGEADDATVFVLSYFDEEEAVSALIGIARDAESKSRRRAIFALGNLAGRKTADAAQRARAVGALEEIIGQGDPDTRRMVVNALANYGNEAAVKYLIEDLEGTDWETRQAAAGWLGLIGDPGAEEALKKLLDDPDESVRGSARIALYSIKLRSARRARGLEVEE
jgi:HEAT repeat protein